MKNLKKAAKQPVMGECMDVNAVIALWNKPTHSHSFYLVLQTI